MVQLQSAIIHSFEKLTATDYVTDIVKKEVVLSPDNPALINLVSGVNGLIGKEGNSVVYGQFLSDGREGRFPGRFSQYALDVSNEAEFVELSHCGLEEVIENAKNTNWSTGCLLLFATYVSAGKQFYLVAAMKEKGGIRLDANYVPIETQQIDLTKVQQAARINLADYHAACDALEATEAGEAPADDEAEDDSTYLCFISRGRDSKASGYFITALGCAKGIASGRATTSAIVNVEKFFRSVPELKPYAYRAKQEVIKYLEERLEMGEMAYLADVCGAAKRAVPVELIEGAEGVFAFLNADDNKVPAEFSVSKVALLKKTRIKASSSNWSLNFERSSLGGEGSEITYDAVNKRVTLTRLTPELVKLIEGELAGRES